MPDGQSWKMFDHSFGTSLTEVQPFVYSQRKSNYIKMNEHWLKVNLSAKTYRVYKLFTK